MANTSKTNSNKTGGNKKSSITVDPKGLTEKEVNEAIALFKKVEDAKAEAAAAVKAVQEEAQKAIAAAKKEASDALSAVETNPDTESSADAEKEASEASKKRRKRREKNKKEAEKARKKVFTDDRGVKFKFRADCPDCLNIDGVSMNLLEIIEDEGIMLELTSGNNTYVEPVYS